MKPSILFFLLFLSLIFLPLTNNPSIAEDGKWFASVYSAKATDNHLNSLIREGADFVDYYLVSIALGKEFWFYKDKLGIEFEFHFTEHYGHQNYEEINGVFVFRWLKFPWDKYLDTSFAIGEGLSYAFEISELEERRHEDVTKLLNFLKFEFGFNLPKYPDWVLFIEIYHRSGMFELFDGVSGACNFIGAGFKYRF